MKKQPPTFDPRKVHLPLLIAAAFVAFLPALASFVPDIYASKSSDQKSILGKPQPAYSGGDIDKSALGPKFGQSKTQNQFQTGFDASKPPAWSSWKPFSSLPNVEVPNQPLDSFPSAKIDGRTALGQLDRYQTTSKDEPISIAIKVDDILGQARESVASLTFANPKTRSLVGEMMYLADNTSAQTDQVYADIHAMYMNVDMMKLQLSRNYDIFNASEKTDKEASQFNAQSDAMADRVAGMLTAVQGMRDHTSADRDLLTGMMEVLDEMAASGKDDFGYYDKVYSHLKDVSTHFENMVKDLAAQGASNQASVDQARKYLSALQDYVKNHKPYANSEIDYLGKVKQYIKNTKDYLDKVLTDIDQTTSDLKAVEDYFRKAKVSAEGSSLPTISTTDMSGDICSAPIDQYKVVAGVKIKKTAQELEKEKPLKDLQSCQKDCRTVCRFKDKRGGQNCYECPSGSPDSCFDVGAWPANHPWCQPGGVCYDDPNMVCAPFGTIGPNLEKLQCTVCKQRPDMCWQKVGQDTTSLTHCMQGCWNGRCVYKGKYKEAEWDGKPEFQHCYKCETPPGPPSCEDMKWGFTWKADCTKNCPAPGACEQSNSKVPGAPQPPGNPPPGNPPANPGNNPGGNGPVDGPVGGDQAGGTQAGGGQTAGGTNGTEPKDLPGGTAQQPEGGGGAAATGGDKPQPTGNQPEQPTAGGDAKPGDAPTSTSPNQPDKPNTGDKPTPPPPPPPPPDTPQISMYRDQLAATEERIKSREKIINDPNEPESVKQAAREQLESMTRERDAAKKRLEDEQKKELDKIKDEEERKRRAEEWERTRPRTPDYAEEARRRGEAWLLNQLKTATTNLQNKLNEAKDVITGRRERLEKIREEIDLLERENQHYTQGAADGNVDSTVAKTQVKANQDRIRDLKKNYAELSKKLQELTQKYNEELERAKSDYRRALWAYDKKAQARADAQRTDEYFDRYSELQRAQATHAERDRTFDEIAQNYETTIRDKKAKGEDTSDLERQLENLRRSQAEWDAAMTRQEDGIKSQLYELERRNFYEGAGPSSPGNLGGRLDQYGKDFQAQLTQAQNMIADLEKMSTRTKEQNDLLITLKSKIGDLQGSIAAVAEKQNQFKSGQLDEEQRQRVHETTVRVANGAVNTDADKSFLRLAVESLGEEVVHTMNPLVAMKKSLAFNIGIVQGVGSAIKGLVDLGIGAVDLTLEVYATDLGFDIETDKLDMLNNMIDGLSTNSNFDGVIKAVVAAGGMIDAKINELSKGDIDWNTANFGGKVAGEFVVGNEVIAAGLGKAGAALGLTEDAATVGRTGAKVTDEAAQTASKAGTLGEDASHVRAPSEPAPTAPKGPAPEGTTTRAPPAETPTPKTVEAPKTSPVEIELPPGGQADVVPRGGVRPGSQATFTNPGEKPVTIKTGEELGHGSTSVVFEDATNSKRAIRITEPGRNNNPFAGQLDEAGRKAVESIQKPNGPIRIPEKGTPTLVRDPNSPLNGKIVEVVERFEPGDAAKTLSKQGGQMTRGQAEAFDLATRELNNNGYAWLDNHTGNYGFEKLPGEDKWRVVVLDPGGIAPMKGATLAEKAENARALQTHMNVRDQGTQDLVKMAQEKRAAWEAKNPGATERPVDMLEHILDGERRDIMSMFGDKIDAAAMGIPDPSSIAYYPFGTLEYQGIQDLGKLSNAEAAVYYTTKK